MKHHIWIRDILIVVAAICRWLPGSQGFQTGEAEWVIGYRNRCVASRTTRHVYSWLTSSRVLPLGSSRCLWQWPLPSLPGCHLNRVCTVQSSQALLFLPWEGLQRRSAAQLARSWSWYLELSQDSVWTDCLCALCWLESSC